MKKLSFFILGAVLMPASFCVCVSPVFARPQPEQVTMKLEAYVNRQGALQGTLFLHASGSVSKPYREVFQQSEERKHLLSLLSYSAGDWIAPWKGIRTDPRDEPIPFSVQIPVYKKWYLLRFLKQAHLSIGAIPLDVEKLKVLYKEQFENGVPITLREEISLDIYPSFNFNWKPKLSEEIPWARYSSSSSVANDNSRIHVVRELKIRYRGEKVGAATVEKFMKIIHEDQQRPLVTVTRKGDAKTDEWIDSVEPYEAVDIGMKAYDEGEFEIARILFERATIAYPRDKNAWSQLGRSLLSLGQLEEARNAFLKQIEINPEGRYTYYYLGIVQMRLGYWEDAVVDFHKHLNMHPADIFVYEHLWYALMQLERWGAAEEVAVKSLESDPENTSYRVMNTVAGICLGSVADPEIKLKEALGPEPPLTIQYEAAYSLAQCGKELDVAEKLIDFREYPGYSSGTYIMSYYFGYQELLGKNLHIAGWILSQKGDLNKAVELLSNAANLLHDSDVYYHLASVLWKLDRHDEALQYWIDATTLSPGLVGRLPHEAARRLGLASASFVDRIWYPIPLQDKPETQEYIIEDRVQYYFVLTQPNGEIDFIRLLAGYDWFDELLNALKKLILPQVCFYGEPIQTAHILKVERLKTGDIHIFRSTANEAIIRARSLSPQDFP